MHTNDLDLVARRMLADAAGSLDDLTPEQRAERLRQKARENANRRRRERDAAMRSLGLVRVRGAKGGTYWE